MQTSMNNVKDSLSFLSLADLSLFRSLSAKQPLVDSIHPRCIHLLRLIRIQTTIPYFALLVLAYVIFKYFVYRLYLHPINQLPGPRPDWLLPLLGNFRQLASKEWGVTLREWSDQYGPIFRFFANGNHPYVFVSDHGLLKYILSNEEYKFTKPPEIKEFLSIFTGANGILVKDRDEHKNARKRAYPALGLSAVQGMIPSIIQPIQQIIQQWSTQCDNSTCTEVVVSNAMQVLTMEILGRTGFGKTFDCLENPKKNPLSYAFLDLAADESPLLMMVIMSCPWVLRLPLPRMKELSRHAATLKEEATKLVIEAKQDPELHQRKDLLGILSQQIDNSNNGGGSTLEEQRDQCLFFLGAGHETSSTCLTWSLYELARNQDVQDKLRQEINHAFPNPLTEGKHTADILTYDKVNQLPYLDNVFKESLRFNPPLPVTAKMNFDEFVWKDMVFPKETRFFISSQINHFDKSQWGDDCDQFLPSRWDRAPAKTINPYAYFPFYQGPRHCIGFRYATIVVKLTLLLLMKNFKFTLKPGFKFQKGMQISLKSLPNMTLMVEKLDTQNNTL